jgi:hypothetical protein
MSTPHAESETRRTLNPLFNDNKLKLGLFGVNVSNGRRLATARREKKNQWAAASANFARRTRHPRTLRSTTVEAMPALPKMDLQRAAA